MDDICKLNDKKCGPCNKETPLLSFAEIVKYMSAVQQHWWIQWTLHEEPEPIDIHRTFTFKDFPEAISFINKVAVIAEAEGHHPDLFLHHYRKVDVTLTTHAIHGLSENDFIVAAKIDTITV